MSMEVTSLHLIKIPLLYVSSRFSKNVPDIHINIGDTSISPSKAVRDLGVILDNNLTMTSHVNNVCRSASYAIYRIGKLRRYLDAENTEQLVHAFITFRLDNCNSILYGLPDKELNKLQRIQNAAARLVSLTKKRDHITPVLFQLHWLPVPSADHLQTVTSYLQDLSSVVLSPNLTKSCHNNHQSSPTYPR